VPQIYTCPKALINHPLWSWPTALLAVLLFVEPYVEPYFAKNMSFQQQFVSSLVADGKIEVNRFR